MDQFSGLSKLRPKSPGEKKPAAPAAKEPKDPKMDAKPMGGDETGTKTHTIEEHPDGHFETHMHDGTAETHPDLLHMTTHVAHHMAPEAKHHHSMHDGFSHSTHGVSEDGQHMGTNEHESTDEASGEMNHFMGGGQEGDVQPSHQQEEPVSMGGM